MEHNEVAARTDKYFSKTRAIAQKYGDVVVTGGVFIRRPVIAALQPAIDFIAESCPSATVTREFAEGAIVPSKKKLLTITAPFSEFVELETLVLQRLGFSCVAAYNAYQMAISMPDSAFLAMDGRHCTGDDMMKAAAYGASIGSNVAKLQGATGFIGTSNDLTAPYFGTASGLGTMPHALVGYATAKLIEEYDREKSNLDHYSHLFNTAEEYATQCATLEATKMYLETTGEKSVTALVDYYGREISDSEFIGTWLKKHRPDVKFSVRLDTHGGRFAEGLDYEKSVNIVAHWLRMDGADEYEVVRRVVGEDVADAAGDEYLDKVRKILFAQGVTVANVINTRKSLNRAGLNDTKIIGSSGFDLFKCQIFSKVKAPLDVVGTGSYMPKTLSETYATLDYYKYGSVQSVKVGREFLFDK